MHADRSSLCSDCAAIAIGDAAAEVPSHLEAYGIPQRRRHHDLRSPWVINYRCDECGAEWDYVLQTSNPTVEPNGFSLRAVVAVRHYHTG